LYGGEGGGDPSFFKIIHGCGHFLPLEAPGALVEVIEEFLLREEG